MLNKPMLAPLVAVVLVAVFFFTDLNLVLRRMLEGMLGAGFVSTALFVAIVIVGGWLAWLLLQRVFGSLTSPR